MEEEIEPFFKWRPLGGILTGLASRDQGITKLPPVGNGLKRDLEASLGVAKRWGHEFSVSLNPMMCHPNDHFLLFGLRIRPLNTFDWLRWG